MNRLNAPARSLSALTLLVLSSTALAEKVEYSLPMTLYDGQQYNVVFAYDTDDLNPFLTGSNIQYGSVSLPNATLELRAPADDRVIHSFPNLQLVYTADIYMGELRIDSVSPMGSANFSLFTVLDASNYINFSPVTTDEYSDNIEHADIMYWTPSDWSNGYTSTPTLLTKSLADDSDQAPVDPEGSIVTYSLVGSSYEGPIELNITYDSQDPANYYDYAYTSDVFPNATVTVTSGFDTFEFDGISIFSDQWTTRFSTQNYGEHPNEFIMEFYQGLPLDMDPNTGITSELHLPWVRVDARDYSSERALIQLNFDSATLVRSTSDEVPVESSEMIYLFTAGQDVIEFGYSEGAQITDLYGNGENLEIRGGRFYAHVQGKDVELNDFVLQIHTSETESHFSITPVMNSGPALPIRFRFSVSVVVDDHTAIPLTEFEETNGTAMWLDFTYDDFTVPNSYMHLNTPSAQFSKIVN